MQIGLIGAGNMAVALARGWGDPVLVHDAFRPRAEALVAELGGEVAESNAELAQRADVIVLCHKPCGPRARRVVGRRRRQGHHLDPRRRAAHRAEGGLRRHARRADAAERAVEVRQGVSCHARDADADAELEAQALALFRRVGPVFTVDESQIDIAMGVMSCAPAYVALVAEAQVDSAVRAGLPADVAGELVAGNLAGTAALLQARSMDTLAVRRSVTSPGGSTARGLAALEHAGLRAAFDDAMQAVLAR